MSLARRVLIVVACVTVALATTASRADADVTIEQRIPLVGPFTSGCTGETFLVTGYFHTKVHQSVSLDGKLNTTTEFDLESVKGVGVVSGATYVEVAETSESWQRDVDFVPSSQTYESDVLMNRLGEDGGLVTGDDSYTKILVHYTVNANGTVTVDRYEVTITCR